MAVCFRDFGAPVPPSEAEIRWGSVGRKISQSTTELPCRIEGLCVFSKGIYDTSPNERYPAYIVYYLHCTNRKIIKTLASLVVAVQWIMDSELQIESLSQRRLRTVQRRQLRI